MQALTKKYASIYVIPDSMRPEGAAQNLSSLRTTRNDADYDMKASVFDNKNCLLWYKKAELCIDSFNGVDKKELRKGIIEYKRIIND